MNGIDTRLNVAVDCVVPVKVKVFVPTAVTVKLPPSGFVVVISEKPVAFSIWKVRRDGAPVRGDPALPTVPLA